MNTEKLINKERLFHFGVSLLLAANMFICIQNPNMNYHLRLLLDLPNHVYDNVIVNLGN